MLFVAMPEIETQSCDEMLLISLPEIEAWRDEVLLAAMPEIGK